MSVNKISALVSGYRNIDSGQDVEIDYVSDQELISRNLHDYHIAFVRDLSGLTATQIKAFFQNVLRSPKLILMIPSQWKVNYALYPDTFLMRYSKGRNVSVVGSNWLAKILNGSSGSVKLSYEVEFSLSKEQEALVAAINATGTITKSAQSNYFEVIARNPSHETVSFISRWPGQPTFVVYPLQAPFKEGLDNHLEKLAKLELEGLIKYEAGYKRKGDVPKWISQVLPERRKELKERLVSLQADYLLLQSLDGLFYQTGADLVSSVKSALEFMSVKAQVVDQEGGQKDILLEFSNGQKFIMEVKGLKGSADNNDVSVFIAGNPSAKSDLLMVVNHYRGIPPRERQDQSVYPPFTPAAVKVINDGLKEGTIKSFCPFTTMELAKWALEGVKDLDLLKKMEESKDRILGTKGLAPSKMKGQTLTRILAVNSKTGERLNEERK